MRRGKFRPSQGGQTYVYKDNVRLKVVTYLLSVPKANQNKMMNDERAGLRGQKWISLANTLNELCEWGWIEKKESDEAANVTVYQLLEKGRKVAFALKEMHDGNNELLKLDSFSGINPLFE